MTFPWRLQHESFEFSGRVNRIQKRCFEAKMKAVLVGQNIDEKYEYSINTGIIADCL